MHHEDLLKQLRDELGNFEQIAQHLVPKPGDLPRLSGFDVHGGTLALNGVTAAQPFPAVFSNEHDRFMEVSDNLCVSFPPLGMLPSFHVTDRQRTESLLGFKERYEMNEWVIMGEGDILLLHTDGLTEHCRSTDDRYSPARLERTIREAKRRTAEDIFDAVMADLVAFAPPSDDVSLVVIKRT